MDPQNWSDERLDALLDQLAERAEERDDISLPGSGVTRRATLAGLLGLGGVAAGSAGIAAAIGESESYGSASGVVGTDSEPLQELNAKNGHFQSAVVDNTLETEQISGAGSPVAFDDSIDLAGSELTDLSASATAGTVNPGLDMFARLLADNEKSQFDPSAADSRGAYLIWIPEAVTMGLVQTRGGAVQTVNVVLDPENILTTTEGNDGTLNIYYDGSNSRYEIENKLGAEREILVWLFNSL